MGKRSSSWASSVDTSPALTCSWCHQPLPVGTRRDALTCSKRCRQARQRFTSTVGSAPATAATVAPGSARRIAYADPPYPGMSRRYYSDHPDYAGEVDHADLIRRLSTYDAWALSTAAASLQDVLALCPPGVRVAAWTRGERPNHSRNVFNAWEPVIFTPTPARHDTSPLERGGRPRRLDTLVHHSRPRLADPHRVVGSKPAAFCRWLFELVDALPGDDFTDLFPGSGGVGRAWSTYTAT